MGDDADSPFFAKDIEDIRSEDGALIECGDDGDTLVRYDRFYDYELETT
jgi:hypothetical protein